MSSKKNKIVQGEDRDLGLTVTRNGAPLDLTGVTEIRACFNSTPNSVIKTLTGGDITIIGSNDCGRIEVSLSDTDTGSLAEGLQGFTLDVEFGTIKRSVNSKSSIFVEARECE